MGISNDLRGRRGIFFTLISLSIVLVVIIFVRNSNLARPEDLTAEQLRVLRLNGFLTELQQGYLKISLSTASSRALKSLSLYILRRDSLLEDFDQKFKNATLTGSIEEDGQPIALDDFTGQDIMQGNTLNERIAGIQEKAESAFGSELEITPHSIGIYQSGPWSVTAVLNASINLTDKTSNWSIKEAIITAELDIAGYSDPMFSYMFDGAYEQVFQRSTVPLGSWDTESLNQHIVDGTYVYWGDERAPSFLMRFSDPSISSKCCGIASLLNPGRLAAAGAGGREISNIDYQFFNNVDCSRAQLYSIQSVDSQHQPIYLDEDFIGKYRISQSDASPVCDESEQALT